MDIRDYANTESKIGWLNSLRIFLEQGTKTHNHIQRRGFIGSCIYRFSHHGFPLKLGTKQALHNLEEKKRVTRDHVYSLNRVSEFLMKQFDDGYWHWDDVCRELPFLLTTILVSPQENNKLGVAQRGGETYSIHDLFKMKHYKDNGFELFVIPPKITKNGVIRRGPQYYDGELRTQYIKELILV
tara:strand:+ start:258 stop:809 length:552 start_codon:yes stop_codon:yes gene_type:complete